MKHYIIMILAGATLAANAGQASEPGNLSLHYNVPASDWQSECLPENLKLETKIMKENLQ